MNVTTTGRPGCQGCRQGWLGHPDRPTPCPICRPHIYEERDRKRRIEAAMRASFDEDGRRAWTDDQEDESA